MGDMSAPVYGVEGDNKYSIVNERVRGEIVMAGPKYDVEGKSQGLDSIKKQFYLQLKSILLRFLFDCLTCATFDL